MDKENSFIVFNYKSFGSDDKLYVPPYEALQELMIHRLEITDISNIGLDRVNRKIEVTLAETNPKYKYPKYEITEVTFEYLDKKVPKWWITKGKPSLENLEDCLIIDNKVLAEKICKTLNEEMARKW